MKSRISKIFLAALLTCGIHVAYASGAPMQSRRLHCHTVIQDPKIGTTFAVFRSSDGKKNFVAQHLSPVGVYLARKGYIDYIYDKRTNKVKPYSDCYTALQKWKCDRAKARSKPQLPLRIDILWKITNIN